MTVLSSLDWLVRTHAPAQLRDDSDEAVAVTLENRAVIDRAARVNTARLAVNTAEANIWATWNPAWDVFWEQALSERFDAFMAGLPDPLGTMLGGTDSERGLLKGVLRVIELRHCRRLGGG